MLLAYAQAGTSRSTPGTQRGMRHSNAEPQKAFAAGSKGAAGGEPKVGGIDQALGEGHTILLAFHLGKQIESTLRRRQADMGPYRQPLVDEVTPLPTLLYQAFEVRIAIGQGFEEYKQYKATGCVPNQTF